MKRVLLNSLVAGLSLVALGGGLARADQGASNQGASNGADLPGLSSSLSEGFTYLQKTAFEFSEKNPGSPILRELFEINRDKIQINFTRPTMEMLIRALDKDGAASEKAKAFLAQVERISIAYFYSNSGQESARIRVSAEMVAPYTVQIDEGKNVGDYTINRLMIPTSVSYEVWSAQEDGGTRYTLAAVSPRARNAIRAHSHSWVGNVWLNEISYLSSNAAVELRLNAGMAGNVVRMSLPIRVNPEDVKSGPVKEGNSPQANAAALLLGPAALF